MTCYSSAFIRRFLLLSVIFVILAMSPFFKKALAETEIHSLDGTWRIMTDPKNQGKENQWWSKELLGAKEASVPGILQASFRGYHGVVWYDREFETPRNPNPQGRFFLRFHQAEYYCEAWVNEKFVGCHEGGEETFEFDVTDALAPTGDKNRIVVRLNHPGKEPIDEMTLATIPRRNNTLTITPGCGYTSGGLVDSVELLAVPAIRASDLQLISDWKTGKITVRASVENFFGATVDGFASISVSSARGGETVATVGAKTAIPAGKSILEGKIDVPDFKLWELNDPNLYHVTVEWAGDIGDEKIPVREKRSARTGFRDFRFENGYFRLNGKRIYLKCSHSGSDSPILHRLPLDPDFYRKDILFCKGMGFNMIRYIAGMPRRFQLDLCDEIGFLVYDECLAGWMLGDSPLRTERWTRQTEGMILRDRNHPSVVIWGLLNETFHVPSVLDAAAFLPRLRKLDPDRVVILNSGNFDCFVGRDAKRADYSIWRRQNAPIMPAIIKNQTEKDLIFDGTNWPAQTLALHPGDNGGEFAVLKWTAPADGDYEIAARFTDIVRDGVATVDLHLFHETNVLYEGKLNLDGNEKTAVFDGSATLKAGENLSLVIGIGDGLGVGDSTAVDFVVTGPNGTVYDANADFQSDKNPNGVWTYGWLPANSQPDPTRFFAYDLGQERLDAKPLGHLANPGSSEWENVVDDTHPYKPVPHTALIINELRTHSPRRMPTFLSEYGIGSGVDLFRLTRLFEEYGGTDAEDAVYYREKLDHFMVDWKKWKLDEVFYSPEEFFRETLAVMAGQRRYGINAIRSNPNVVGHSVTGTHDQGISGEGLTTIFRELKPGTFEVMADLFAKLRFCLFVEPVQLYPDCPAKFEAVLVNEDILPPGDYPIRLQIVGPPKSITMKPEAKKEDGTGLVGTNPRVYWDKTVTLIVPNPGEGSENPFVLPLFNEEITLKDAPEGEYHFLAEFEKGGAAAGGDVPFYVTEPTASKLFLSTPPEPMDPDAEQDENGNKNKKNDAVIASPTFIVWGNDADLLKKLAQFGIQAVPFHKNETTETPPLSSNSLILVGRVSERTSADDFTQLYDAVKSGAQLLFLSPDVLSDGTNPLGRLPFDQKGSLTDGPNWLYHKDDWNRVHPIFDRLPAGHVMDYLYYRDVIPQFTFSALPPPDEAIAGGFNVTFGYSAGISIGVWKWGEGRIILNTFKILENLPNNPVAERILCNLLTYLIKKG